MLHQKLQDLGRPLILASQSPRRRDLLQKLDIPFTSKTKDTDESYPDTLSVEDIALYIAKQKAKVFEDDIQDEIIITADTIVVQDQEVLTKPNDRQHAFEMLQKLSGKTHRVSTGVCIFSKEDLVGFTDHTDVHFKTFTEEEINYYLDHYKPFDKAGSYGAQEWMGMIGMERLEGSYYNVMGLPVHQLYTQLLTFIDSL